jgi:small subunit ribosomal protein S15
VTITREDRQKLIAKYQHHHKDSGSSEVQIALLTGRIKGLTDHFKTHKKDHHSRRGLLAMVSRRRKLLDYLKRTEFQTYSKIIQELEIRK